MVILPARARTHCRTLDPGDLLDAAFAAAREAVVGAGAGQVAGIGVASSRSPRAAALPRRPRRA
jgi:hypothetical protein